MRDRAYGYPTVVLLGLALLAALPVSAQELSLGRNQSAALDFASLTKAACHGDVSCQPNYPSCASWSGYSSCGEPLCDLFAFKCGGYICDEWGFCEKEPGPAWGQPRERFRVCFDQYGNSCTEWDEITTIYCGYCS